MKIWLEDIETGKPAELKYKTTLSAGFDIPCRVKHNPISGTRRVVLVKNQKYSTLDTGLRLRYEATQEEIDAGLPFLMICPRSSSVKNGVKLMNSPAIIDLDYEGEIKLQLGHAHATATAVYVGDGDCYVQGMFISTVRGEFEVLNKTRGTGGLGSTDNKKNNNSNTTTTTTITKDVEQAPSASAKTSKPRPTSKK